MRVSVVARCLCVCLLSLWLLLRPFIAVRTVRLHFGVKELDLVQAGFALFLD